MIAPGVAMGGVSLPGGRRVELRQVPVPAPGHRQVLVEVRASGICGSDLVERLVRWDLHPERTVTDRFPL